MSEDRSAPSLPSAQPAAGVGALTDEQVKQVADKVFAMLRKDLRLEAERARRRAWACPPCTGGR